MTTLVQMPLLSDHHDWDHHHWWPLCLLVVVVLTATVTWLVLCWRRNRSHDVR